MKTLSQEMLFVLNLWTMNTVTSQEINGYLGPFHGLSFTEYMVLFHLKNADNKSMRRIDLARNIGVTASGITRLISPMEKTGLVMKEKNRRDARVSLVMLSPGGESILNSATTSLEETSKNFLKEIETKKLEESLDVFKSISKDLFIG
jgi:DNA-binding MarR family transcriptional regulator